MPGFFNKNLIFIFFIILFIPSSVSAQTVSDWPMAGANPARTSWVAEGVGGNLAAKWAKPMSAFIPFKVQLVAADNKIYVSTAKGLYAIDSETGAEKWVYATSMPLGHSPTYANGVLYVGGFDKKLHAVNAVTGAKIWTYDGASAGYHTNPVVVNGVIYIGNNDGYFYAINTSNGSLKWKTQIGSPIRFSPAFADNTLYFTADDTKVYALDAATGSKKWTSEKLKVRDFHSWWPTIYNNYLLIVGIGNYREVKPGDCYACLSIKEDVWKDRNTVPEGEMVGVLGNEDWIWDSGNSTPTVDMSKPNPMANNMPATEFLEARNGWSKEPRVFVINRTTGQEVTWDFDNDGKTNYAPYMIGGTHGNGYPAIVSPNGIPYFTTEYRYSGAIAGGGPTAWKFGTPFIGLMVAPASGSSPDFPRDEPYGITGGGNYLYWNLTDDRYIGGVDVKKPLVNLNNKDESRQWRYAESNWKLPGYDSQQSQYMWDPDNDKFYWSHADNVGPIPYKGKLYVHRGNAVIALAPGSPGSVLPVFNAASSTDFPKIRTAADLQALLVSEISKMLAKGSLRPAYWSAAMENRGENYVNHAADYFHNPGENLYVLLRALPYLSTSQQSQLKTYIQNEYTKNPLNNTNHIGWNTGSARESALIPPEAMVEMSTFTKQATTPFGGWKMNPFNYYAMWKYAQAGLGSAVTLFNTIKSTTYLVAPSDSLFVWQPHVLNAYIAGYQGWLGLEKMAGLPATSAKVNELNRLLALRANQFTWDLQYGGTNVIDGRHYYSYRFALNFLYLTQETADYLRTNALSKVQTAVTEYNHRHPYWFVAKTEIIQGESDYAPLQQYAGIFQAKAMILKQPFSEVEKYLDVPAVETGDMYYINNLVATLETACTTNCPTPPVGSSPSPTLPPGGKPGDANNDGKVDGLDYVIWLNHYNQSAIGAGNGDFNNSGKVDGLDYVIWLNNYLV